MLSHTFCYIPRKGKSFDRFKSALGLSTWRSVLEWEPDEKDQKKASLLKAAAEEACEHCSSRDLDYFAKGLPSSETWLLFPYFRDSVCYLDIETTGLGKGLDYTTVATVYDGSDVKVFTHGLNMRELPEVLESYKICVTFNGKCFDLPFLRSEFQREFPLYHIDLRYVFASLGLKGGLKKLEKEFGIGRGEWTDLNGYAAVLLWQWHQQGLKGALETLTAYNILDTVDLEKLMVIAYNLKVAAAGAEDVPALPLPEDFPIPFKPDNAVIKKALRASTREFY
ncbi:ribonuclease H-like domain-containing protein [bacterium]|nr:ribonuclease H-like domain-containing protein [bacterium]